MDSLSQSLRVQRVMVVDDNNDAADGLIQLIRLLGYHGNAFYDAQIAIAEIERFNPTLVVSDLQMAPMDGFEFARSIRKRPQLDDILIFSLSSLNIEEAEPRAREAGFNGSFAKPLNIDLLKQLLNESWLSKTTMATIAESRSVEKTVA